jgi:hypothetical protein
MTSDARMEQFFREMDARRGEAKRLEPVEIGRLALNAGLTPREALLQIHGYFGQRQAAGEPGDALAAFVSKLCAKARARRTLEYFNIAPLLTTEDVGGSALEHHTFVVRNTEVSEVLRIAVDSKTSSIVQAVSEIPEASRFDAIVCQPPIGHKPTGDQAADGFGGEGVRALPPFLAERGTLYWVTGRGVLWTPRAQNTLADLNAAGLNLAARIDVAPGAFPGTTIQGAIIALRRDTPAKIFVGALRDLETAEPMASALLAGPTRKSGLSWTWLDGADSRTFAHLEQERIVEKLTPRGRHTKVPLSSLLQNDAIVKADRPVSDEGQAPSYLFIPEYAGSRVTADLDEQTVKPKAVYRLAIDPSKASPRFLAQLLNSPLGKHLRESIARGATIQRTSVRDLLTMPLPIPDLATQERIARIDGDIGLLRAAFGDMQASVVQDWNALSDVADKIDRLKAVLDIEKQIADWWRELPYPLATIYRRYQVSTDPKERLETLLHFFEMAAVYLATIGTSHVKAMRSDWQDVFPNWLHPAGAAGIKRADFGFWIGLAGTSLKETRSIDSNPELRDEAIKLAGQDLVQVARTIGLLGKATDVLNVARNCRNSWIGHGGHIKASDAARLDGELQQPVRDFYEIAAPIFRRFQLVRPGPAYVTDTAFRYEIDRLSGSDPTFEKVQVELERPAKTDALAFWMTGAKTMCRALPFFRLGVPQRPQETSFYVFNRVESGGCRWISYQEAREQEFVAPDDELLGLISLGRRAE